MPPPSRNLLPCAGQSPGQPSSSLDSRMRVIPYDPVRESDEDWKFFSVHSFNQIPGQVQVSIGQDITVQQQHCSLRSLPHISGSGSSYLRVPSDPAVFRLGSRKECGAVSKDTATRVPANPNSSFGVGALSTSVVGVSPAATTPPGGGCYTPPPPSPPPNPPYYPGSNCCSNCCDGGSSAEAPRKNVRI